MCSTDFATYSILGCRLKLDFNLDTLGVEVDDFGCEAAEEGFNFMFRFAAVLAGFDEGFQMGFAAGLSVFFSYEFTAGAALVVDFLSDATLGLLFGLTIH